MSISFSISTAHLDDLRSRGIISPNDAKIVEWKRSNLPNLMGSEAGRWMLDNNLMEYYSEQMNKDLHQAAASMPAPQVGNQGGGERKPGQ